jgi:hypothetical protein
MSCLFAEAHVGSPLCLFIATVEDGFKHQCRLRACHSPRHTYHRSPQVPSFLSERSSVYCLLEVISALGIAEA